VVTRSPVDPSLDLTEGDDTMPSGWPATGVEPSAADGDGNAISRINLRMPERLKTRIERAAGSEGLSVNSWLVRAAAAALERSDPARRRERRTPHGAQRYTGWAR
jgi:hypothetical protein